MVSETPNTNPASRHYVFYGCENCGPMVQRLIGYGVTNPHGVNRITVETIESGSERELVIGEATKKS